MTATRAPIDTGPATPALDTLRHIVSPYEGADDAKAWLAFATSVPPFVVVWYAMYRSLSVSYWLTLALSLLGAGFTMRTFIVQHDCGHGSFFRSLRLQVLVGRLCSLITLVPYAYFRRFHATHHATSGKLHARGVDITTLTVREYLAMSARDRRRYRLMRNPIVLFVIGPLAYFVVGLRLPFLAKRQWKRERRSILLTDLSLAAVIGALVMLVGTGDFIRVQLPITVLASTTGMWLFYVQHQFEHTYWAEGEEWDFGRAALEGSSHYALPPVLAWFTGYIGLHHVHHLSPRVPSYRLTACHSSSEVLLRVPRVTMRDGFRVVRLRLWDEEEGRLVPWPKA